MTYNILEILCFCWCMVDHCMFFILCFVTYSASDITTDYCVSKEKHVFCTVNCALWSTALNIWELCHLNF